MSFTTSAENLLLLSLPKASLPRFYSVLWSRLFFRNTLEIATASGIVTFSLLPPQPPQQVLENLSVYDFYYNQDSNDAREDLTTTTTTTTAINSINTSNHSHHHSQHHAAAAAATTATTASHHGHFNAYPAPNVSNHHHHHHHHSHSHYHHTHNIHSHGNGSKPQGRFSVEGNRINIFFPTESLEAIFACSLLRAEFYDKTTTKKNNNNSLQQAPVAGPCSICSPFDYIETIQLKIN